MKLFTVRDKAAGTFGAPFHAPNAALAIRLLEQVQMTDEAHVWGTHPQDFQVHYLGEFDETTGTWDTLPFPEPLLTPLPKKKES